MPRIVIFLLLIISGLSAYSQDTMCLQKLGQLEGLKRTAQMDSANVVIRDIEAGCMGFLETHDSLRAHYYMHKIDPAYAAGEFGEAQTYSDSALNIMLSEPQRYGTRIYMVYERQMRLYHQSKQTQKLFELHRVGMSQLDSFIPNDTLLRLNFITETAYYQSIYSGDVDSAIVVYEDALKTVEDIYGKESLPWLQMMTRYMSPLWYGRYYDVVEEKCKEIIAVNTSMGYRESKSLEGAYFHLARVAEQKSDYYQAIQYYKKQADISKNLAKIMYDQAIYGIGKLYYSMGECERAQPYFEEIIKSNALTSEDNYLTRVSYPKVASCYGILGDSSLMNEHFSAIEKYYENNDFWLGTVAEEKAKYYLNIGNNEEAHNTFSEAINQWAAMGGPTFQHLSKSYINRAQASLEMKKYADVLSDCSLAKKCIGYSSDARNYSDAHNLAELLQILRLESNVYLTESNGESRDSMIQMAIEKYDEILDALDYVRFGFKEQQSYNYLNQENFQVFDDAIRLAATIDENDTDQIFNLIERSKDMYLLEALTSTAIRKSDRFIEYESIKARILELERQLDYDSGITGDSLVNSRKKLTDLRLRHNELYQGLTRQNDKAFKLQFDTSRATIADVQKKLDANEAFLALFSGENRVVGVVVFNDDVINYEIKISNQLESILSKTISEVQAEEFQQATDAVQSLAELTGDLFDKIISDLIASNISQLVISPDGWITQVPFEMIEIDEGYLIDKINCRYAFSASQFTHSNTLSHGRKFIGIAPTYQEIPDINAEPLYASLVRSGNWSLPHAQDEINFIHDLMGGDVISGDAVNKSSVIQAFKKRGLVHFSGHAVLDAQNPTWSRLVFTPVDSIEASLSVAEIYNLNIPSYLTTLSACNTASGSYEKGNGVNSLARAFHFAGSDATIVSLWPVPDESTKEIMQYFYSYLKEGLKKSEALRQAKLDYIDNVSTEAQKHPIYWAGFILIGQDGVIPTSNHSWLFVGLGFLMVFLIFIIALRARKRGQRSD